LDVAALSPDVTLGALRLRHGARFVYEYDLNIPWHHEVRIKDRRERACRLAQEERPVRIGKSGSTKR